MEVAMNSFTLNPRPAIYGEELYLIELLEWLAEAANEHIAAQMQQDKLEGYSHSIRARMNAAAVAESDILNCVLRFLEIK